jgi:hypothetical protein
MESVKGEGKKSVGKPTRRRENNIKTDLKEIVCESLNWIQLAHLEANGNVS